MASMYATTTNDELMQRFGVTRSYLRHLQNSLGLKKKPEARSPRRPINKVSTGRGSKVPPRLYNALEILGDRGYILCYEERVAFYDNHTRRSHSSEATYSDLLAFQEWTAEVAKLYDFV